MLGVMSARITTTITKNKLLAVITGISSLYSKANSYK
jgi:hypothetical protein